VADQAEASASPDVPPDAIHSGHDVLHRHEFFDPPDPARRIQTKSDPVKEILMLARVTESKVPTLTTRSHFHSRISDYIVHLQLPADQQSQLILEVCLITFFALLLCTIAGLIYYSRKGAKERSQHGGIVTEAPARRGVFSKIFGRTQQPQYTPVRGADVPMQGGSTLLTTEADAHVTARLVPEAELKQRSPLPCTPSNETAAPRNLDHAPHVVERPADGLFPSAKPTEAVSEAALAQPPSPQSTAPAKPLHGAAKSSGLKRPTITANTPSHLMRSPSLIKRAGGSMLRPPTTPKAGAPSTPRRDASMPTATEAAADD